MDNKNEMKESMKLKSTNIGNKTAAKEVNFEQEKSQLIWQISVSSNLQGDMLVEFMDTYKLNSLQEAKVEQLRDFVNQKKDALIHRIDRLSDQYGDKLIDFLNTYKLNGLQEATLHQLTEYTAKHDRQLTEEELEAKFEAEVSI